MTASGAAAETTGATDLALAEAARAGDGDAFEALVTRHQSSARRLALAALGNLADADEALQEALMTAWTRLPTLDRPAAFRSWFLRITWRKALDRRRSVRVWWRRHFTASGGDVSDPLNLVAAPAADVDARLVERERDRLIARTIRSLPSRLRDPFLLAASGEHRYEEIAATLAVPVGTVKWRVSEARRLLRQKLARLGVEDAR